MLLRYLPVLLLLLSPAALAQVADDFADGDFTADPPWTGDADRFTVVPFGNDFALRSAGLAQPDTIALATASDVAFGRWTFTFRHETNLSTANGTRVYLVADTPDLKGEVQGYYVQLGTNNTDQIRLYRQDGAPGDRALLGNSEGTPVAGDTNTVFVEVLRDAAGGWEVRVDGETVIADVQDATYTTSGALGVWLKHSTATGDRFTWDDFLAEPGDDVDLTPPVPVSATAQDAGAVVLVTFDEALDPASVTPDAFTVTGVGQPLAAEMAGADAVRLAFDPALPPGLHTLLVSGVADHAGNIQPGAEIAFTVEEADTEPPVLVSAVARSATEVEIAFDEIVTGCDASRYEIDRGVGQPANITCPTGPSSSRTLVLGQPLQPGLTYTVTARNIVDEAGNVQPQTSISFFFGTFDVPAPRDVVVNEIMYDPPTTSANEYVEVFNRTADRTFDLSAFVLADETGNPVRVTAEPLALAPGQFAVLVRDPGAFEAAFPDVPFVAVAGFPALNNTGDAVVLRHVAEGDTVTVDSVRYAASWGGADAALERRSPDGPSNASANWATSTDPAGGTPGAPNSVEPDTAPPVPVSASISDDGLTVTVAFDEPLDPATVRPGAFAIDGGVGMPTDASYDESGLAVLLTLAASPPGPGTYTVTVSGVADLLGNVTEGATVSFDYEPDVTPPALASAFALDATTIDVLFSERVEATSASDPANYAISDGIGQPAAVTYAPEGDARRVRLTLGTALEGPQAYTLTARNIADPVGNVLAQDEITFFFGEGDIPQPGDLVVNEIMYDPPDAPSNEWIEVLNVSERVFDLSAFSLADEGDVVRVSDLPHFVLPGDYAVLVRNAAAFEAAFPGVPHIAVSGFPNLNNSGDAVVLRYEPPIDQPPVAVDSVRFSPSWGGRDASLERRSPAGPSNSAGNWATSLAPEGGTPGAPNSLPPDTEPPAVEEVIPENDGLVLHVLFDEALDPASVDRDAFEIEGVGAPVSAAYVAEPDPVVTLTLPDALAPGEHVLTVRGLRDLQGNEQTQLTVPFTFAPDRTPPALVGATAPEPTRVEVAFSEPLDPASAAEPSSYSLSDGIGRPEAVEFAPDGDSERVALLLARPLEEGVVYTLTASGVADRFGNVLASAQIRLILGGGDAPQPGDLVINEVMYQLPSERNDEEYVELYNRSERTFDLNRLTLSDTGDPAPIAASPRLLLPGEYVAVVADAEAFAERFGAEVPFVEMPRFPSLNNGADAVVVRFEDAVIDSLTYDAAWQRPELDDATGIALERIDPDGPSTSGQNWSSSLDPSGGTPGRPNSVVLPPGEAPARPGITADPSPFQADIGTQIRYTLESEAALVRVRIFDGAGRLVRTLEEAALGGGTQTGTLTWRGLDDAGRPLRIGIYIVFLEAIDLQGARTEAYKTAVVLGRQL